MSAPAARSGPLFPYELAIANAIVALLAVAAIFDNKDTELRFQILTALALITIGALLLVRADRSGYLPGRRRTERLREDQRNLAGWTAITLVVGDLFLAPAMFLS